ncbi:hypothetical protein BC833DRAFT_566617 [Globomyces pollinis-pini]|nr:hypothetical protein BC833DRAFT_566617 [Globomyces pollinis-pini]
MTIWKHSGVRYITLGWSFFIAENVILSHNRTDIIERIGDDNYHRIYNTLSSVACGSIAYGFLRYGRKSGPLLSSFSPKFKYLTLNPLPKPVKLASFSLRFLSLLCVSQMLPKLQLPWEKVPVSVQADQLSVEKELMKAPLYKSRCPIDFSSTKDSYEIVGMKRITRHPSLYSFGLFSFSFALTTNYITHAIMFTMPLLFSIVGSFHQDYRYRRGQGGELTPEIEAKTSNIPMLALAQVQRTERCIGFRLSSHFTLIIMWRCKHLDNVV